MNWNDVNFPLCEFHSFLPRNQNGPKGKTKDNSSQSQFQKSLSHRVTQIPISVSSSLSQTEKPDKSSRLIEPNENEALLVFLLKSLPYMEKELFSTSFHSMAFESTLNTDDDEYRTNETIVSKISLVKSLVKSESKEFFVSCLIRNEFLTIVSSSTLHGNKDCFHLTFLEIWKNSSELQRASTQNEKSIKFQVSSCVTSLAVHPKNKKYIVFGTHSGFISSILIHEKEIDSFSSLHCHDEPLTSCFWLSEETLFSTALDGKVILYTLSKPYNLRPRTVLLISSQGVFPKNKDDTPFDIGITASSLNVFTERLLLGTEAGLIVSVSLGNLGKGEEGENNELAPIDSLGLHHYRGTLRVYGPPINGRISTLSHSPFHSPLFLSGSSDGFIRLYSSYETKAPLLSIQIDEGINSLVWSDLCPTLFYVSCSLTGLKIMNLKNSLLQESFEVKIEKTTTVSVFRKFLLIGTQRGETLVYSLSSEFLDASPQDSRVLMTFTES